MEIPLKLLITLVVCVVALAIVMSSVAGLIHLWRSQLDPWQTMKSFFTGWLRQTDNIATRDPNLIYQDGQPVGRIEGDVVIGDGTVEFALLADTGALDRNKPFQYQRLTVLIRSVHGAIGAFFDVTPGESRTLHNVMQGVVCDIQP